MNYNFSKKMVLGALVCAASVSVGAPVLAAAAARVTQVQMGTGKTDNYEIVSPATEFTSGTAAIFCIWRAEGIAAGAQMRGVWVAEDVGKVAPPNYKIDEAAVKVLAANEGYFSLSKPTHGFPVGKYRLEIYMGNSLLKTVPFMVRAQ